MGENDDDCTILLSKKQYQENSCSISLPGLDFTGSKYNFNYSFECNVILLCVEVSTVCVKSV